MCRHRNLTVALATVELTELLIRGSSLAVVGFVVSSTLGVGLSLTVGQILAPLKNVRLVGLSLAANFVLAPLAALGLWRALGLDEALGTQKPSPITRRNSGAKRTGEPRGTLRVRRIRKSRNWPGRAKSHQPPIDLTGTVTSATPCRCSIRARNGSSALWARMSGCSRSRRRPGRPVDKPSGPWFPSASLEPGTLLEEFVHQSSDYRVTIRRLLPRPMP